MPYKYKMYVFDVTGLYAADWSGQRNEGHFVMELKDLAAAMDRQLPEYRVEAVYHQDDVNYLLRFTRVEKEE